MNKELIDWDLKEKLDNYDSGTCLKFPPHHQFLLKKLQVIFPWYLNVYGKSDTLGIYQKNIDDVLKMNEKEWDTFNYDTVNDDLTRKMEARGATFYKTHFNRSIAIKVPTFWGRSSLQRQHEIADPGEQMD